MKTYIPLFLELFIKFKVLSVPQLELFCGPKCSRRRIYEHLADLMQWGFVERVTHKKLIIIAYSATTKLLRDIYGIDEEKHLSFRAVDLAHTLACNRAAIALMRYSFVSGLSLEHELGQDELRNFCHDRRPDGIVQVTRADTQYELAIEVETSIKALYRIGRILKGYKETFESKTYLCAGVVIIAPHETAFHAYQNELEKMPGSFRDRVILQSDLELEALNQKYFGARLDRALTNPHSPPHKTRSLCGGAVRYLPMKTVQAISPDRNKGHL